MGFSFRASAQRYRVTVVNNSGCSLTYELINAVPQTFHGPITVNASNSDISPCDDLSNINEIKITNSCGPISFYIVGGFPETLGFVCPGCSSVAVCTETVSDNCSTLPIVTAEIVVTIN